MMHPLLTTKVLNVLLVEDSDIDVTMARSAIRKAKAAFELTVAERGERAKAMLQEGLLPDLILLDLNLPGIYGLELLGWLKSDDAWRGIPTIVFTTSSRPSDVREAYRLGAACYIQKPNTMDELIKIFEVLHSLWVGTAVL